MSILDDIKAKADANGDGKINADDLESLRNDENSSVIDKLKETALGSDGKFSMEDVQRNFEDLKKNAGDAVDKAKDSLGNIFGGK